MKIKNLHAFELATFGRCSRNGEEDARSHGTFQLMAVSCKDKAGKRERQLGKDDKFDMPSVKTNHAAAYGAMIEGLKYTRDVVDRIRDGFQGEFGLSVTTNDPLVHKQVMRQCNCKAENLVGLREQIYNLVKQLHDQGVKVTLFVED